MATDEHRSTQMEKNMTDPISATHALTLNAVRRDLRVSLSAFIGVHLWLFLMDQAILAALPV
jgi:hypothetical protein